MYSNRPAMIMLTKPLSVFSLLTISYFILQDNPDYGVLYLVRGLLNVIQDYVWDVDTDAKATVFLNVLCLLSACSQEQFIYHIKNGK